MGVTLSLRIGRVLSLIVAGLAAASLVSCGTEVTGPAWVAPSAVPAAVASTKARPARITSACTLLPANAVVKLLGGTSQSKLAAREEPAEKSSNGNVWRHCVYGRDGEEPFALGVGVLPERADTVKLTIDAVAKAGGPSAKRITGLGADAVAYVDGGGRVVMAVVPFGKELRSVVFSAPKIVPQDKLEDVARYVLEQI